MQHHVHILERLQKCAVPEAEYVPVASDPTLKELLEAVDVGVGNYVAGGGIKVTHGTERVLTIFYGVRPTDAGYFEVLEGWYLDGKVSSYRKVKLAKSVEEAKEFIHNEEQTWLADMRKASPVDFGG